ncbi:hypothetical protein MBLNU459_g5439t1 [Dothideomycetes sp. NU459]
MRVSSLFGALALSHIALAIPLQQLQPRASSDTTSVCSGNTATDRSTWCDYSLSSDYYEEAPDTGVIREYWLELVEATVSPDGYSRPALLVNGSFPGPTLEGDWGDTFVIHVTNKLTANGTSIHFHGIRQNYTNQQDGVASITQCPTAPDESITYTWRATQYGTTWYHSHFQLQAWEGVFGGIIINGPASANYEQDMGVVFLSDWSHQTADELYPSAETRGPPTMDNGLIGGKNVYGDDDSSSQTGSRYEVSVSSGTSYRIRLVNSAIDTHFKWSIDNHTMTVIANDLVPIVPYETTVLDIAIGQRYDVVVTMSEAAVASDFWMRAVPQLACSDNDSTDNIKAIVHYDSSDSTPTTTAYSFVDSCDDEDLSDLVPYLSLDGSDSFWEEDEAVAVGFNSANLFRWYMNSVTMVVEWDDPTLLQVYNNATSFTDSSNVIELPTADEWAYVVIQTSMPISHPIHLHGHDFLVLAQGTGTYSSSDVNLSNPTRRDVATLPASGYLVLAFQTDNPGVWLMHCHIGWHTEMGLALEFIERQSEISALIDADTLTSNCDSWSSYATDDDIVEDDSGI